MLHRLEVSKADKKIEVILRNDDNILQGYMN